MFTKDSHYIRLLIFFVLLMLLPNLSVIPVSIMESRDFITAREMITDNHWLLTTMNEVPRYEKPPLPTWLAAISASIFGVKSVFGMRLPGVLMVVLLGIFSFKFSQFFLNNRAHSFRNALILVTSFYVIGIILEAPWDIFTHAFMLMALFYLVQILDKETWSWRLTILAALAMGASILSKGPVSLYALFLPFLLAYGFAFGTQKIGKKALPLIVTLALGFIAGAWWYFYVRHADPATFIEIAQRETGNWTSYNVRPFYYYWSFFVQSGIWTVPAFISLFYPLLKKRVKNAKVYKFTWLWTLFSVILLSLIPEKKSRYLMPVLIPLALNIGFYIEALFAVYQSQKKDWVKQSGIVAFGLIGLVGLAAPFYLFIQSRNSVMPYLLLGLVLFILGILIVVKLRQNNIKSAFYLTIVLFASAILFGIPTTKHLKSDLYRPVDTLWSENQDLDIKAYYIDYIAPRFIWQYGTAIPEIKLENNQLLFPDDNKIGLFTGDLTQELESQLLGKYQIQEERIYDLNYAPKDVRRYKDRLVRNYYILTKRQ